VETVTLSPEKFNGLLRVGVTVTANPAFIAETWKNAAAAILDDL